MRTLFNHHNIAVGKVAIGYDNNSDKEVVQVWFDSTKTHYKNDVVPLENFDEWKKVRDLKEVVDMDDANDGMLDDDVLLDIVEACRKAEAWDEFMDWVNTTEEDHIERDTLKMLLVMIFEEVKADEIQGNNKR